MIQQLDMIIDSTGRSCYCNRESPHTGEAGEGFAEVTGTEIRVIDGAMEGEEEEVEE